MRRGVLRDYAACRPARVRPTSAPVRRRATCAEEALRAAEPIVALLAGTERCFVSAQPLARLADQLGGCRNVRAEIRSLPALADDADENGSRLRENAVEPPECNDRPLLLRTLSLLQRPALKQLGCCAPSQSQQRVKGGLEQRSDECRTASDTDRRYHDRRAPTRWVRNRLSSRVTAELRSGHWRGRRLRHRRRPDREKRVSECQ